MNEKASSGLVNIETGLRRVGVGHDQAGTFAHMVSFAMATSLWLWAGAVLWASKPVGMLSRNRRTATPISS